MKVSKYDHGLFMYQYRGTLHGVLVTHSNDFLRGGSHVFVANVIKSLYEVFEIRPVNKKTFRYLGLYFKGGSSIVISHSNYVDSIESLKLDGKKDENNLLNETDT